MLSMVGFEYIEINAKRVGSAKNIKINHGVKITNISLANANFVNNEAKILRIGFDYLSVYEPKVGLLNIKGNIFVLTESKNADEILNKWNEKKAIEKNLLEFVINIVLQRCTIDAILISQKLNLPSPVPLPKVKVELNKEQQSQNNKLENKETDEPKNKDGKKDNKKKK